MHNACIFDLIHLHGIFLIPDTQCHPSGEPKTNPRNVFKDSNDENQDTCKILYTFFNANRRTIGTKLIKFKSKAEIVNPDVLANRSK